MQTWLTITTKQRVLPHLVRSARRARSANLGVIPPLPQWIQRTLPGRHSSIWEKQFANQLNSNALPISSLLMGAVCRFVLLIVLLMLLMLMLLILPALEKLEKLQKWPQPTNIQDYQSNLFVCLIIFLCVLFCLF